MPKRLRRTIRGKRYIRYNAYKTKTKAEEVAQVLRSPPTYYNVSIQYDDRLKIRKYVVWKRGGLPQKKGKLSAGNIKKGRKTRIEGTKYKPRKR